VILPFAESRFDRGRVSNAELEIGVSDRFTHDEIAAAMDVVKASFSDNRGRNDELLSLVYSEVHSDWRIEMDDLDQERTIVLFSDWYQGQGFGRERQWMPWTWILSRQSPSDSWVVIGGGKI